MRTQRGAALLIALLMLIVLLMLGVAAVHIGLQSEKMSRNRRDRQIAWQAAEATLLDAEYDIGNPNSQRYSRFGYRQSSAFAMLHDDDLPGLYFPAGNSNHPVWRRFGTGEGVPGVNYGRYSGRTMQTGIGALPSLPPRYVIEMLPREADQAATDRSRRYRISAFGFGPDPHTRVMLQSIYRRQSSAAVAVTADADAAKPPIPPSMRLSWREIATWESV